jgi:osmotically inducible protein OsmC
MADIQRTANAVWRGDLKNGEGVISTPSGVLQEDAYSFVTRFENSPGTNPEELVAAAHAACFSMAFSNTLARKGYTPEEVRTRSVLTMEKQEVGFTITRMRLEVEGRAADIDQETFQRVAEEAEQGCPISRLLRPGLQNVEVVAKLV